VRNIDGSTRLFSAQNTLYLLPLGELTNVPCDIFKPNVMQDEQEFKRLYVLLGRPQVSALFSFRDKQHTILRVGLLGLYPARGLVSSILTASGPTQKAILDIGVYTILGSGSSY
jgi:hypothetical protein